MNSKTLTIINLSTHGYLQLFQVSFNSMVMMTLLSGNLNNGLANLHPEFRTI